jgi:hypothetical protein
MSFFIEIEKNPKIHVKAQKSPNSQSNPEQKKCNVGGMTILDFKLYYRAMGTKPAWYWHKKTLKSMG